MASNVTAPFGEGSISMGLYLENLDAHVGIEEMLGQAHLVDSLGFDGVTISEHHAGLRGYLPVPVIACSWVLERIKGWSAAMPILAPLWPVTTLLEEIAWTAARYPGRIAAGLAPGFSQDDFDLVGVPIETRRAEYYARLTPAVQALTYGKAEGLLGEDAAIQHCAQSPVPVIAAVAGPVAVKKAAQAGAGILIATFKDLAQSRELSDLYLANGGNRERVLIRRCWLGAWPGRPLKNELLGRSITPPAEFSQGERDNYLTIPTADELIEKLVADFEAVSATSLSIRIHIPGTPASASREQIERIGKEVLPEVRKQIAANLAAR